MGLFDQVKSAAKASAKGAASRAREVLERRLGNGASSAPARAPSGARSPGSGPAFSAAEGRGLDAWLAQARHLREVGDASSALFQARFVDSELALREALSRLEAAAAAHEGQGWSEVAEGLAAASQEQNARILARWREAFQNSEAAWRRVGQAVSSKPWQQALGDVASSFDEVWLHEWEQLQEVLEQCSHVLKGQFEALGQHPGLTPPGTAQRWTRALSAVDGGLRRAQGDLWGAWGTQAALIRGASRKVIEGEGDIHTLYPPLFQKMQSDLATVIRANVEDLRDSWIAAIDHLSRGLEERG